MEIMLKTKEERNGKEVLTVANYLPDEISFYLERKEKEPVFFVLRKDEIEALIRAFNI